MWVTRGARSKSNLALLDHHIQPIKLEAGIDHRVHSQDELGSLEKRSSMWPPDLNWEKRLSQKPDNLSGLARQWESSHSNAVRLLKEEKESLSSQRSEAESKRRRILDEDAFYAAASRDNQSVLRGSGTLEEQVKRQIVLSNPSPPGELPFTSPLHIPGRSTKNSGRQIASKNSSRSVKQFTTWSDQHWSWLAHSSALRSIAKDTLIADPHKLLVDQSRATTCHGHGQPQYAARGHRREREVIAGEVAEAPHGDALLDPRQHMYRAVPHGMDGVPLNVHGVVWDEHVLAL
ncbi:hypothetical protein SELMODRAFT_423877 [Selaginella moellendorffii]|uniref:Uncharacterized protein n=1 Tax=Selaginella moellendorffii TaxID=88036 RepID=D8SN34_SELML|nr:hypothetical protein SELMODRAFT_423877 [Selaginella moellendorffii]